MANPTFDAIIVGARCAGSSTAMLLARKGYKVLVVDRATFPSDTISTHMIHPQGVGALERWGLRDRLVASGCPAIDTYAFDFGEFTILGAPGTFDSPVAYCPRRIVLDKLLLDAAVEAGAEVREGFVVDELITEDDEVVGIRGSYKGEPMVTETARVVIGADGLHSMVARAVGAATYREGPPILGIYYAYWSGLDMGGRFDTFIRPNRGFAAIPTHDGLTVVITGWPYAELAANKRDLEGSYLKTIALAPSFAERVRAARRETPIVGMATPNFFRKPFGPGWALVGDAGYTKDPITAQGISDAFGAAERLVTALDESWSGLRTFDAAMSDYQKTRDELAVPMFELTCEIARLEPPPPHLQRVLEAVHGNQEAMDQFCRVNAGVMSPAEFFSDSNVEGIFAAALTRDLDYVQATADGDAARAR